METIIVAAEHFTLTPAIRERIDQMLAALGERVPEGTAIRLFLSQVTRKEPGKRVGERFRLVARIRLRDHSLTLTESGEDLYRVLTQAGAGIRRLLTKDHQRVTRARRGRRSRNHEDRHERDDHPPFPSDQAS